jgi:hypothetical protein
MMFRILEVVNKNKVFSVNFLYCTPEYLSQYIISSRTAAQLVPGLLHSSGFWIANNDTTFGRTPLDE